MIGQDNLIYTLQRQIDAGTFPRFSILVGIKGSGKKALANLIPMMFKGNDYTYTLPDVKVETIRKMIEQSYKNNHRTFYIIPDADKMSLAAKNAILKVTEEPPNNAYFIMTLQDKTQTLPTIISRGTVYRMEEYSRQQLKEYAETLDIIDKDELDIIKEVCRTPLDVKLLKDVGITDFYDYVQLVVENIAEVSGSNCFKIADKIAFKDTDTDKYDMTIFLRAFMSACMSAFNDTQNFSYLPAISITSKALQESYVNGINKPSLFDKWILEIRQEWM